MNLFFLRLTFFLFLTALFFSCTKISTTDIGSGLIPPVDGVNTKDTVLDVVTKNASYDTVAVGISDNHVLGFINDPNVFGKTTASLNFQIAPPSIPFSWGVEKSDIVVDSVVLCLSYKFTWGDTSQSQPLKLHVYSMDPEVVFKSNITYNNTQTFEKSQELTEFNTAKTIDITTLNDIDTTAYNEAVTSQIRIRLNNSFGQQLVDYDSASIYKSDSTFYNSLRGLIVEPEETGNGLMVVSLTDTLTRLSVYYHSNSVSPDSVKYSRKFSPNILTSASSNSIIRNYEGTQIPAYVSNTDTNQDLIFMQTSPGVYASIKTPGLDSNFGNRIVHRAELLMYQVPADNDEILTPPNLFLAAYSSDSMRRIAIPNDVTFSNGSISNLLQFGVTAKSISGKSTVYYSFDITRYVQGIITRKEKKYDLVLLAPYNQYIFPFETFGTTTPFAVPISTPSLNIAGIGRVLLGGGTNSQYKMRLHIVYSSVQ